MGADYLVLPHEPTTQQVRLLTERLHLVPLRPSLPGTSPGSMWPRGSSRTSRPSR
ncbi:hypothetical protein FHS32_005993 [Streptomyces albaduncus]|uniref:Uncharacterized protein n=1 Tax=Streptomyces griseoloalbus TaxID=67303 RepID=A0A7W8BW11_9ACTN|nr:hypothetical protein [Streptomyces albaduncus]